MNLDRQASSKNQEQEGKKKREYQKPSVQVYGNIAETTKVAGHKAGKTDAWSTTT